MWKDFQRRNKIFLTVLPEKAKHVKTLDEFLSFLELMKDEDRNEHFRTQSWFISENGKLLPEHIFDINNLEELNSLLGINIPHANKIDKKIELTSNQIEKVNLIYKKDFILLNYKMI